MRQARRGCEEEISSAARGIQELGHTKARTRSARLFGDQICQVALELYGRGAFFLCISCPMEQIPVFNSVSPLPPPASSQFFGEGNKERGKNPLP